MTYTANIIPAMTSATAPSGVASSSSNYAVEWAEWKAFDHLNAVEGAWASAYPDGIPGWVGYQFPVAHVITRYAVTNRVDDAGTGPSEWTFLGSTDGSTWVTLDTQMYAIDWAETPNTRMVIDIANAVAYAYYRLNVTAVNGGNLIGVGELEMMETVRWFRRVGKNGQPDRVMRMRG